jgi:hypothetical protein
MAKIEQPIVPDPDVSCTTEASCWKKAYRDAAEEVFKKILTPDAFKKALESVDQNILQMEKR